jgi:hypothetical protein
MFPSQSMVSTIDSICDITNGWIYKLQLSQVLQKMHPRMHLMNSATVQTYKFLFPKITKISDSLHLEYDIYTVYMPVEVFAKKNVRFFFVSFSLYDEEGVCMYFPLRKSFRHPFRMLNLS